MSTPDNLLPASPARVMVALSGGVDSSVAAACLLQAGHQVSGVTMRLWRDPALPSSNADEEPGEESARRLCAQLGIPFYVLDLQSEFRRDVVEYFGREYAAGRTPNPCLACNRWIKFGVLLQWARKQGADYLATGHYARRRYRDGLYWLLRGVDRQKEQSYVLYQLDQETLRQVLFPLGAFTKEETRALARELGLPTAERRESQEICFIPDNDYRAFLMRYWPEAVRPGPIYDRRGRLLGQHKGLPFYTIGQRKGLGIAAPEPLYVLDMDAESNSLIVGVEAELGRTELLAKEVHFIAGRPPNGPLTVTAKIRYLAKEVVAVVTPLEGAHALVRFDRPLRDITPGQAVVFYQGEVVLGGGIIA